MEKRILSALLALCMAVSLLPAAFAASEITAIANCKLTLDENRMPTLTPSVSSTAKYEVSSIVYDTPGPVAINTWAKATVTYTVKAGGTFAADLKARDRGDCGAVLLRSDSTTAVVQYYAWVKDPGSATQEMKDYAKAHQTDTANSRTPVAVGRRFDPIADQRPDTTGYHTARAYKYPIAARKYAAGDLPEGKIKIYDLHAEQLFSSGVEGQWYLVCYGGNKLGFVPAACITVAEDGGSSGSGSADNYWADAPGVWKVSSYTFAGGTGTRADPYLIATADQLNAVRRGLDKHYKLVADIDLSKWGNWTPIGGNPAYEYNGRDCGRFTGTLDGNGHVISGMTIVDHRDTLYRESHGVRRCYGLFNNVWNDDFRIEPDPNVMYENEEYNNIWDLGLVNYTIDLRYNDMREDSFLYVGTLAAFMSNSRVSNCYASGGAIRVQTGGAHPEIYIGGLVSNLGNSAMVDCYNASPITYNSSDPAGAKAQHLVQAGGLVWGMTYCWLQRCFNTGDLTVAYSGDMLTYSVACGIAAYMDVGEIPGVYNTTVEVSSYLKDCYNTGALTANGTFGLMGYVKSDFYMDNCYSVGKMKVDSMALKGQTEQSANDIASYSRGYSELRGNRTHNGVSAVSGSAWQYSAKLGRKVLKSHPEDTLNLTKPAAAAVGGFKDVLGTNYFADPVLWAVKNGITNGTSTTAFSPTAPCSRAQILTFLWRSLGKPEPTVSNPFTDVTNTKAYYYKPALWAYEMGMLTGKTFGESTPCTRGEAVYYLWKAIGGGKSDYIPVTNFTDVPVGSTYSMPVSWASYCSVTNGVSSSKFGLTNTCTRGEIVTFLWRAQRYRSMLDDLDDL